TRPVPRRDDVAALRRAVDPQALLQMEPLPEPAVAALLGTLAGAAPGPLLLRLAAGAAGDPLYPTELVGAPRRGRGLAGGDGVAEAIGGSTPPSLAAAIADRLSFLSPPGRQVLQAAALLGVEFVVSDLAAVLGRRVTELLPELAEARAAGIVTDAGEML